VCACRFCGDLLFEGPEFSKMAQHGIALHGLQEGDFILVRDDIAGPRAWHERRILAAPPGRGDVTMVTPQGDFYEEELFTVRGDIAEWFPNAAGAMGGGARGLGGDYIHAFAAVPLLAVCDAARTSAFARVGLPAGGRALPNLAWRPFATAAVVAAVSAAGALGDAALAWHERLILVAPPGRGDVTMVTPQGDFYEEELFTVRGDIAEWFPNAAGAMGGGARGIGGDHIHAFAAVLLSAVCDAVRTSAFARVGRPNLAGRELAPAAVVAAVSAVGGLGGVGASGRWRGWRPGWCLVAPRSIGGWRGRRWLAVPPGRRGGRRALRSGHADAGGFIGVSTFFMIRAPDARHGLASTSDSSHRSGRASTTYTRRQRR
jgi:hypothetical protein